MMNFFKTNCAVTILLCTLLITSCGGEGIDRNHSATRNNSTQNDFSGTLVNTGLNRYIALHKLHFEAAQPSIISVLFQATDQYGSAIAGLQTRDFRVLEDNNPVPKTETSLSVVPHKELPFSLKTVLMVDTSSSITTEELNQIKAALRTLIVNDDGSSKLHKQQQIAIYTFDDRVTSVNSFSSDVSTLLNSINSIQPAYSITPTNLYGAVIEGALQWQDQFDLQMITHGTMIIITDGTDTAARNSFRDAVSAIEGKSVYTLGVGNEISTDVMSSLGTSGSYYLYNFDQLNNTLQGIAQRVNDTANSFYYLHYASTKRRAAGAESNSTHHFELSVIDNANRDSNAKITDSFNSAEFRNVTPQVVIAGQQLLTLGDRAIYTAATRWGAATGNDYIWSISNATSSCAMDSVTADLVRITAVAVGTCTIAAVDQLANGARAQYSITVLP